MKGKDLHPRLLYPAKLSFIMEGKIKCFSDKVKLKEFIIIKPLLYEMLKAIIQVKEENQKQTKQTTRTGTESQKKRSHGGLLVGKGRGEWEKDTGNNKYKW